MTINNNKPFDGPAEWLASARGPTHLAVTMANNSVQRRLWSALATGIPYGVFKAGAGLAAIEDVSPYVGIPFIVWGMVDIVLNLISVPLSRRVGYCLLSNIGRRLDKHSRTAFNEQLFLAIDTLLSFIIVSTMIGFGRIRELPQPLVSIWEVSVIATILAAGVERVWRSARVVGQRRAA